MYYLVTWLLYFIGLLGVFSVSGRVSVSVMEGDSVTLYANVDKNIQEKIKWYFNDTRLAEITGDQSKICTDVQCKDRFSDRLKLDHQTGSLTITNTRNTDSGEYHLEIINSGKLVEMTFSVSVCDVSAAERDEVKEGESVTLDPGVKNLSDSLVWYFNDTRLAEITGDQSKICADDQCKERFRDRLELDHQTGSLKITNTRNTDTGVYHLEIISNSSSISRKLPALTVIAVPGSGLSPAVIAGISAAVVLLLVAAVAAAVIYYRKRQGRRKRSRAQVNGHKVGNGETSSFINHTDKPSVTVGNGTSCN
ncbi:uncharacterized protein LOC143735244 isoform X2 [Siphateles boraxobius]|uniref:uncharacterized protein LOC143735244 isoform X2 n=1 Tax=Siphateles boraxobius TaxID=180520 RepID=UPI004063535A